MGVESKTVNRWICDNPKCNTTFFTEKRRDDDPFGIAGNFTKSTPTSGGTGRFWACSDACISLAIQEVWRKMWANPDEV